MFSTFSFALMLLCCDVQKGCFSDFLDLFSIFLQLSIVLLDLIQAETLHLCNRKSEVSLQFLL